eukprot:gene8615-8796_t
MHCRTPWFAFAQLDEQECSTDNPALEALAELLDAELAPAHRQLLQDATEARSKAVSRDGEICLQDYAEQLAACGYPVWLRTGKPEKCCSNQVSLRHTFVVAAVPDEVNGEVQLFVVDPSFKDSFVLSNATPAYAAVWQALPELFVGTARHLVPLVELLCTQIQLVFAETASSCPPWRQPSCMITKWLPTNADDVQIGGHNRYSAVQSGAQAAQEVNGRAIFELSRSSSGVSSSNGSLGGLCTPSSCYTAIVAANSGIPGDTSTADVLGMPGAGNRGAFDRTSSGNILLSGSIEELGAGSLDPPGDFAAVAAAAAADQGHWEAACYVQAGSPLSCVRPQLGCCGALWAARCGDEDGFDDDSVSGYDRDQDVGGIDIKPAGASSHAAAACGDFQIPVGQLPPAITCQLSEAATAAVASPAVTPKTLIVGLAGLDMARFDRSPWADDDLGVLLADGSLGRLPVPRSVSEPARRSPGKPFLRQSSALSAALASLVHKK